MLPFANSTKLDKTISLDSLGRICKTNSLGKKWNWIDWTSSNKSVNHTSNSVLPLQILSSTSIHQGFSSWPVVQGCLYPTRSSTLQGRQSTPLRTPSSSQTCIVGISQVGVLRIIIVILDICIARRSTPQCAGGTQILPLFCKATDFCSQGFLPIGTHFTPHTSQM